MSQLGGGVFVGWAEELDNRRSALRRDNQMAMRSGAGGPSMAYKMMAMTLIATSAPVRLAP